MKFSRSFLTRLLNDESFIRWIKEDERMSESEKTRWDKWSKERPENELLVKRAKKILTMPFRELDVNCDDSGQLDRLIKAIKDEGDEE